MTYGVTDCYQDVRRQIKTGIIVVFVIEINLCILSCYQTYIENEIV